MFHYLSSRWVALPVLSLVVAAGCRQASHSDGGCGCASLPVAPAVARVNESPAAPVAGEELKLTTHKAK